MDNDKLDLLFLLVFSKCINSLNDNIVQFQSIVIENLESFCISRNVEEKKLQILKENYLDEFREINVILKNELSKIINVNVTKTLNNLIMQINIDSFVYNYYITIQIIESQKIKNDAIILKFQTEFAKQYFENRDRRLRDSLNYEDWNSLLTLSQSYQNMVNFIANGDVNIKTLSLEEAKIIFEDLERDNQNVTPNGTGTINPDNKNIIEINGSCFKLMLTTLDIIKTIYDVVKLITLFDKSLTPTILSEINLFLFVFLNLNKEIVLEGEGVKKGRLKAIYQKEISIVCANVNIVKNLTTVFYKRLICNDLIFNFNFNELHIFCDKLIHTCKCNISDLFLISINNCMDELNKIDFSKYPIFENENPPLNPYTKKFILSFRPIYIAMLTAFENNDIIQILSENLKLFFDKIEKYIISQPKIENENSLKQ